MTGSPAVTAATRLVSRSTFSVGALALALLAPITSVRAQSTGDGFFFERSKVQLSLHGGFANARTDSKLFDFTTEQLTVDPGDFDSFTGGIELAGSLGTRFALTFAIGYSKSSTDSEFREWVDQDDQPIEQTTSFSRLPITIGGKAYIIPPGVQIGQLAWVPSRFAPYIGAGLGIMPYTFVQEGDWVDFQDLAVFTDTFEAKGTAALAYLSAGLEFSLSTRVGLTTEIRNAWARGSVPSQFVGFDKLDLSGTNIVAGVFVRF